MLAASFSADHAQLFNGRNWIRPLCTMQRGHTRPQRRQGAARTAAGGAAQPTRPSSGHPREPASIETSLVAFSIIFIFYDF